MTVLRRMSLNGEYSGLATSTPSSKWDYDSLLRVQLLQPATMNTPHQVAMDRKRMARPPALFAGRHRTDSFPVPLALRCSLRGSERDPGVTRGQPTRGATSMSRTACAGSPKAQWNTASALTSMLSRGGTYCGRGSVKALCGAR
jgi:hypothetical protein